MMGSVLQKMNITCTKDKKSCKGSLPTKHKNNKQKKQSYYCKKMVKIDGFSISRDKKVTICPICAKTSSCSHTKHMYLCTNAGYWYDTKKKYKWKIMGRYRLIRWLRSENKRINTIPKIEKKVNHLKYKQDGFNAIRKRI